jgi:hypothetical protein
MEELGELITAILTEAVTDIEQSPEGAMKDELMLLLVETLTTFFETDDVCLKVAKNMLKKIEKSESGGAKHKNWLNKVKAKLQAVVQQQ